MKKPFNPRYKNNQRTFISREATEAPIREKPAFAREGVAIAGEIQIAVTGMTSNDFAAWLRNEFDGELDNVTYQTAKTLISTYIEAKLKIRHGVRFIERRGELLLQISWVKNTPLTITPASWMVEAIEYHPRPVWNINLSDLILLPND